MKILLVDDEHLARARLAAMIGEAFKKLTNQQPLITEAENGIEALTLMTARLPDILFLDIEMPGMTGLEVLAQLEKRPTFVVFATAHDEFAIKAFEENACDYLLKPFSVERLEKTINKIVSHKTPEAGLATAEATLHQKRGFLSRILVRQGAKSHIVDLAGVEAITSKDHFSFLHERSSGGGIKEHIIELSLDHLEKHLDPALFIRIHRSAIVSCEAVIKLRSIPGSETGEITLKSGMTLPVSKRKRQSLISRLRP